MNELIRQLKTGSQEAWKMMINMYSKKVYNMALNFAGNKDDASDITQDIFLKVYTNIDKFNFLAAATREKLLYRLLEKKQTLPAKPGIG
jgi:DNA-directed RNA polymerase specialized sigma24 family protein